jgi:uncharacterized membrane-anchored protein
MIMSITVPVLATGKDDPKTEAAGVTQPPSAIPPEMAALEKSLHPQTGDVRIPAAKAVLHLGDRYYFLPADEAKRVLVEAWRNPPDSVSNVLGLVLEKDSTIFRNVWGAVVTYDDSGHVSDSDANSQDYGKVLTDMRASEVEDNKQRKSAGYQTMSLVGWAQAPSYDASSHSLIWAREYDNEGEPVHGLNYDVRLLGRTGVLSLNMVSDMSALSDVRNAAQTFGKSASFEPGATYADFSASTDKTAEYGLAGLVAGGAGLAVAQKLGLFAIILKFGKVILIGLAAFGAAIAGFFRKMFRGKDNTI